MDERSLRDLGQTRHHAFCEACSNGPYGEATNNARQKSAARWRHAPRARVRAMIVDNRGQGAILTECFSLIDEIFSFRKNS